MSNDENKSDKMQPANNVPRTQNKSSENVVAPEVKILNRGDLLGAINCLFPELQLKSGRKHFTLCILLRATEVNELDYFITII